MFLLLCSQHLVSIHAPTRGATRVDKANGLDYQVSIHAPTRGATLDFIREQGITIRFNPRSHTGSDQREGFG